MVARGLGITAEWARRVPIWSQTGPRYLSPGAYSGKNRLWETPKEPGQHRGSLTLALKTDRRGTSQQGNKGYSLPRVRRIPGSSWNHSSMPNLNIQLDMDPMGERMVGWMDRVRQAESQRSDALIFCCLDPWTSHVLPSKSPFLQPHFCFILLR